MRIWGWRRSICEQRIVIVVLSLLNFNHGVMWFALLLAAASRFSLHQYSGICCVERDIFELWVAKLVLILACGSFVIQTWKRHCCVVQHVKHKSSGIVIWQEAISWKKANGTIFLNILISIFKMWKI